MRMAAFFFVVAFMAIGLLRLLLAAHRLEGERLFTETYINKFRMFSENYLESFDPREYHWLTHRVMKLQFLAGDTSYWDSYGGTYATDAIKKSESLVSILDQMGQQPVPVKTLTSTTSFLVRFLGVLDDYITEFKTRLRSPLTLFREGVQVVLLSPVLLASWARGSEREVTVERIMQSARLRSWVAFLSVMGLLIPILVIILGWEPFQQLWELSVSAAKAGYDSLVEAVKELLEPPPAVPPTEPPVQP